MIQTGGKRAAIYARFSSDLQRDASIDDQFALCSDYCARQGIVVVARYSDRALTSASLIGRAGVNDLLAAISTGAFDCIVVENMDRLSRDMADLGYVWKLCQHSQVRLLEVHAGEASTITVGLRGLMGAVFLKDLADKTRRGLSGKIRSGQRAGGVAYGYRAIPGRPGESEIVPEHADIVRRIMTEYAAGKTPRAIAIDLNNEGVAPPRGLFWNPSSIQGHAKRSQGMLNNEVYAGEIVWNKVGKSRHPKTGKRVPRINPPSEWQRTPAPHLAIISKELWDRVQERQHQQRHRAFQFNQKPRRIFSGLLKCAACGSGVVSAGMSRGHAMAVCSRANETGQCEARSRFNLEAVEAAVMDVLRRHLATPDLIAETARAYEEETRRLSQDADRNRSSLERKRGEAQRTLSRLIDAVGDGSASGRAVGQRMTELETQIDEMDRQLAEIAPPPVIRLHPKAIEHYLKAVASYDPQGAANPATVEVIRQLIAAVVIHPREARQPVVFDVKGRIAPLMRYGSDPDGAQERTRTFTPCSTGT